MQHRLAFLGCGHMGSVIARRLLKVPEVSTPLCSQLTVSVSSDASARRLETQFAEYKDKVNILCKKNVQAARDADVVLLCFPPSQVQNVLSEANMAKAVQDKLIVSILAGVSRNQIQEALNSSISEEAKTSQGSEGQGPAQAQAYMVRAMPSLGAQAGDSATLVVDEEPPLPRHLQELTENIFKHIGPCHATPPRLFEPLTALAAVSHALMSVAIDAIIDSSVAGGIPRDHALALASTSFRGYSTLLARGDEPAELKKSLLTAKGFTPRAMVRLEKGGVRSAISDTVLDTLAYMESMSANKGSPR